MSALLTELREAGLPMGTRYAPTSFTDPATKEDHVAQLVQGCSATTTSGATTSGTEPDSLAASCFAIGANGPRSKRTHEALLDVS